MKKWDLIIIIVLIILSVLPITLIFTEEGEYEKKEVFISVDGNEYSRFNLDGDEQEITIENSLGKNIIYIKDESVLMKHTDCPDRLCTKQGKINKVGESIVCLPNKVFVEIIGISKEEVIISH